MEEVEAGWIMGHIQYGCVAGKRTNGWICPLLFRGMLQSLLLLLLLLWLLLPLRPSK